MKKTMHLSFLWQVMALHSEALSKVLRQLSDMRNILDAGGMEEVPSPTFSQRHSVESKCQYMC